MGSVMAQGDQVRHPRYGIGTVRSDLGDTVIVRFADGIEECARADLEPLRTSLQALDSREDQIPLEAILRVQAEAIMSANDTWGVFSRSKIEVLPHQLWVCKQVRARWPSRWLVADDVGLGKTIEAGLILSSLLSRGMVRRLLVLCPSSLVEQWQYRMREMFDIRLQRYLPELDTPRTRFWEDATYVVASLHTVRADHGERHERLFASEPWDLVIVDEAHHLNADEEAGPTLGYRLIDQLDEAGKVGAMVFFTGTPHRGKPFGFWSLLRLLDRQVFDPNRPPREQLARLGEYVIRNNKQNVTDLQGKRLFQPPRVSTETYEYSPAEARFYAMLTEFIVTGRAYASGLNAANEQAVTLVLIALQKLASSSVAAILRALRRRLATVEGVEASRARLRAVLAEYATAADDQDLDRVSALEELRLMELRLDLMADELPRLRELIAAAEAVTDETKIQAILALVRTRFSGRSILFFTEYKATQSLLMSALIRELGDGCVTFINGDEHADEVIGADGVSRTLRERRASAAERFNRGEVRFLVSTEAGGEGIDLQERCHSLVHVDLPWNPMRLHQRVGRLNRYGQTRQVEVVSLRNPDTVEARIWDRLNEKIAQIMLALGAVMDEPEDLLELVLGMTSPSMYTDLFVEGQTVVRERMSDWFDGKTARFGGQDVLDTVRDLTGNAARFDYGLMSERLPRVDLPDLKPFFRAMVISSGRRVAEDDAGRLSFLTPTAWQDDRGVLSEYEGLHFDRRDRSPEASRQVVGAGHRVFDRAITQARELDASAASIASSLLTRPLVALRVVDRVTTDASTVRSVIVGIELAEDGQPGRLLADWELLQRLNAVLDDRVPQSLRVPASPPDAEEVRPALERARAQVAAALPSLELPFRLPAVEPLAAIDAHRGRGGQERTP
jgi:superfamily II DNA or RNA helicase